MDGRANRYVDHGTTGDALVEATAISCADLSADKVDNSSSIVGVSLCLSRREGHAQTIVGTSAKDLGATEVVHALRDVNKHITAILHLIAIAVTGIALSGTEHLLDDIAIMTERADVNEGIVHVRFLLADTTAISSVAIVVVAVTTTKDILHTPLIVLHIGGGRQDIGSGVGSTIAIHLRQSHVADLADEAFATKNMSTEVVTAIDMVTDPWEACHGMTSLVSPTAHIGLGVSEDIGIARTGKGVENSTVAEVDVGAAVDKSLETTAIDELSLSHLLTVALSIPCHASDSAVHIDVGAVLRIIVSRVGIARIADRSQLTAAEYLEGIAAVEVDGGGAPDFGRLTIATAENIECGTQHVHTLLVEDDTGVTFGNRILVFLTIDTIMVELGLTLVLFHLVEDGEVALAVYQ